MNTDLLYYVGSAAGVALWYMIAFAAGLLDRQADKQDARRARKAARL